MRHLAAPVLAAVACGCASAATRLPDFIFSLTAWASGPEIEFLLLNVTQQRVKASNNILSALLVEVRDDAGQPVTRGPVRYQPASPSPQARDTRSLRPNRVFRQKVSTELLLQRIEAEAGASLDRTRRYSVRFETLTPVIGPKDELVFATVRSRSVCTISFVATKPRADCGSG